MKIKLIYITVVFIITSIVFSGCSSNSSGPSGKDAVTSVPEITALTADKTQILYGGSDPAVITCLATGGNLKFIWEVDLGDIIPLNSDRSKVRFTGSACCVGDKIIKCTVSNDKGTISKNIIITILEEIKKPEIITIESSKTQLNASTSETATLVCYATGGNLKYSWTADCGDIAVNPADNSKITYTAKSGCEGNRTITCKVTNEKGEDTKTIQVTVLNK